MRARRHVTRAKSSCIGIPLTAVPLTGALGQWHFTVAKKSRLYRSGKSTFIDMLSGRKSIGQLGGAVRVDGSAARSSILTNGQRLQRRHHLLMATLLWVWRKAL